MEEAHTVMKWRVAQAVAAGTQAAAVETTPTMTVAAVAARTTLVKSNKMLLGKMREMVMC